jgi:hypothetical protein
MTTTVKMTNTRAPLPLHGEIAFQASETITVTLTRIYTRVYRVRTTNSSGFELADWTRSYADEASARAAARHAALAFRACGDVESLERLRDGHVAILAAQERRTSRRMHSVSVVAEATRVLDSIATLDELDIINELRDSLAS